MNLHEKVEVQISPQEVGGIVLGRLAGAIATNDPKLLAREYIATVAGEKIIRAALSAFDNGEDVAELKGVADKIIQSMLETSGEPTIEHLFLKLMDDLS